MQVSRIPSSAHVQPGIIDVIEEFIADFATLPNANYALPIALWALGTHCYEMFDAYGFLMFTADSNEAGKTRMLEILSCICGGAKFGDPTLASMCADIEEGNVTMLYDQAESLSTKENNSMLRQLLKGYRKGQYRSVLRKGRSIQQKLYCPKAFALVGAMAPAATTRAMVVPMRHSNRKLKYWRFPEQQYNDQRGGMIRAMCAAIVEERKDDIEAAVADFDGLRNFDGREEEIWTAPFLLCALFCPHRLADLERAAGDIAGGKRATPKRISVEEANRAALAMKDGRRLVKETLMLCGNDTGIRTAMALERLVGIADAPWRNYAGVGLTNRKMAELLKPLGVRPKQFWQDGENRNGYRKADLQEALDR